MTIMICDDQVAELENIKQIVSDYVDEHKEVSFIVKSFSNPFDMLDEIQKSGAPDVALLDICMPGLLGTDVAREISENGNDGTDVIFLTTSSEFAVDAFSLRAYDYLTKPFSKERLIDSLDRVLKKRRNRSYITVSCGRDLHRVDLFEVLYLEAKNHDVELHLSSGKILKTRAALSEIKKSFMQKDCFLAVGASYIVNLLFVQSLLETTLEMSDGSLIPVPRRLRNEVRDKYFDFYSKEATKK